MASGAGREILTTKCPFSIMAGHAARSSLGRVMVERERTHHLPSQRQSGSNSVTIGASQIL
jgi:hypothetical protein